MSELEDLDDVDRFWLDTSTGQRINLARPAAEHIHIEDIAGALSRTCRFGGHSREYFSVAQHVLLVEQIVGMWGREDLRLIALHHDSHEAYVGDIPSPLKKLLASAGGYDVLEAIRDGFDRVIEEAFRIDLHPKRSDVRLLRQADGVAFALEARRLLASGGNEAIADRDDYDLEIPFQVCPEPLGPADAEEQFLTAHERLMALGGSLAA